MEAGAPNVQSSGLIDAECKTKVSTFNAFTFFHCRRGSLPPGGQTTECCRCRTFLQRQEPLPSPSTSRPSGRSARTSTNICTEPGDGFRNGQSMRPSPHPGSEHRGAGLRSVLDGRHNAYLLEERHDILFGPFFGEFAICNAMNGDGGHSEFVIGSWCAGQVTFVLAGTGKAGDDPIPFGDLVFNVVPARCRGPEDPEGLFEPFSARRKIGQGGGL